MKCVSRTHGRRQRGSILLESVIGIFVLVIAALSYFSMTVMTHRSQAMSSEESKAAQMCARLLEQIQLLKPSNMNGSTLGSLNLIDAGQVSSPYSFTNIPLDHGTYFSPSRALRSGTGELTVTPLTGGSYMAVAEIKWVSPTGKQKSFKTGTVVGGYK